jgi:hypothetical protein
MKLLPLSLPKIFPATLLALSVWAIFDPAALAADGPKLRPIPEAPAAAEKQTVPARPDVKPLPSPKTGTLGAKPAARIDTVKSVKETKVVKETATETKQTKETKETKETKAAKPAAKTVKTVAKRGGMVPPPPPNTVTMLSGPGMMGMGLPIMGLGMDVDFLSKDALKDRAREVSIQYKDAQAELESKRAGKLEREERAKNFEGLFSEGVVSRRELESSQREAKDSAEELRRLENRFSEVKALNDRINKRLAFFAAKPVKTITTTVKKKTRSTH